MAAQIDMHRQNAVAAENSLKDKEVSKNIAENRVAALLRARGDPITPKNQYS